MRRCYISIPRCFLVLVTTAFLAVAFLGCNDPTVRRMEERNQEFGFFIEQELERSRMDSKVETGPATLPPAQAADMDAERREMERMVERGEWEGLFN